MLCSKLCCLFFPKCRQDYNEEEEQNDNTNNNNIESTTSFQPKTHIALSEFTTKDHNELESQSQITIQVPITILQLPSPSPTPSCFDLKYYRENEYNTIIYTKKSIIDLFESELQSPPAAYKTFCDKDNIKLSSSLTGSLFTSNFPMIKTEVTLPKSRFTKRPKPSIPEIVSFINDREKRLKWDKGLKDLKVIESIDNDSYILYSLYAKPIFFISEREIVDKKIDFYVNGVYYTYSSSVNDDFYPVDNDIVRVVDYISTMKIYEDDMNYYVRAVSQVDLKMVVSQSLLNITLPSKLKEWYNNLVDVIDNEAL